MKLNSIYIFFRDNRSKIYTIICMRQNIVCVFTFKIIAVHKIIIIFFNEYIAFSKFFLELLHSNPCEAFLNFYWKFFNMTRSIQSKPLCFPFSSLSVANNCIPTQIPKKGFFCIKANFLSALIIPSILVSPSIQDLNAPCPGSTTWVELTISDGKLDIFTSALILFSFITLIKDCSADKIFPKP